MKMHTMPVIALAVQVWAMLAASSKAEDIILPENLDVPVGYTLYRCAEVVGTQFYEMVDGAYVLKEPFGILYEPGTERTESFGNFEAGPSWEFDSGKTIQTQRLLALRTVDENSLDWLLIEGIVSPGEFEYIKQTDTSGGLPPTEAQSFSFSFSSFPTPSMSFSFSNAQSLLEVPFTATHCFYNRTAPE